MKMRQRDCLTLAFLLIFLCSLSVPTSLSAKGKPSFSVEADVVPNSHLYMHIDGNQLKTVLTPVHPAHRITLPRKAYSAINKAPYWLSRDLLAKFGELALREVDVEGFSSPTFGDLDGDGLPDLVVGSDDGALYYYDNLGSRTNVLVNSPGASPSKIATPESIGAEAEPVFIESFETLSEIEVIGFSTPALGDLDGDGELEIVVGVEDGTLHYYDNLGNAAEPRWVEVPNIFEGIDVGTYSSPALGDLDGDGDLDLFVGALDGYIYYYENTGTVSTPIFTSQGTLPGVAVPGRSAPTVADLNGDSLLDIVIGAKDGKIYYYENTGDPANPWIENAEIFAMIELDHKKVMPISGDYEWFSNLGNYLENTLTHEFDIISGAKLEFWTNYGIEENWDYGYVEISTDGETWTTLKTYTDRSGGWIKETVDLSGYLGHIWIRFRYSTDGGVQWEGWYIDDLSMSDDRGTIFVDDMESGPADWVSVGWILITPCKFSQPLLADVNEDGCHDLVIGEKEGILYYIENLGSPESPVFTIWRHGAEDMLISTVLWGPGYHPEMRKILAIDPSFTYVNKYADLLLGTPRKYLDEVAYTIAYEPAANLVVVDAEYYLDNAEAIYDMAEKLNYVRISEKPREHATTLAYIAIDGEWKEMPLEIYYKRVVTFNRYLLSPGGYLYYYHKLLYRTFLPYDETYGISLLEVVKDAENLTDAAYTVQHFIYDIMGVRWHPKKPPGWYNIYMEQGGMCGEQSILVVSLARSMLIPTTVIVNLGEDHQWNEYWDNGEWHHWDANSPADVGMNHPEIAEHRSAMMAWENDGEHDPTWPRTRLYTDVGTLKFTVRDVNGEPVDGARVEVWSNWGWYTYGAPLITMMNYTDLKGKTQIQVGYRPEGFTIEVISRLGSVHVTWLFMVTEGETYEIDVTIPKAKPEVPQASVVPIPEGRKYVVNLEFEATAAIQCHPHWIDTLPSNEYWTVPNPQIDFYVTDEENYQKYLAGYDFEAYVAQTDIQTLTLELAAPADTYIIFSNEKSLTTTVTLQINIELSLLGDVDGDGDVGPGDFYIFSGAYGTNSPSNPECDLDMDGDVDPADFYIFSGNYGQSINISLG